MCNIAESRLLWPLPALHFSPAARTAYGFSQSLLSHIPDALLLLPLFAVSPLLRGNSNLSFLIQFRDPLWKLLGQILDLEPARLSRSVSIDTKDVC